MHTLNEQEREREQTNQEGSIYRLSSYRTNFVEIPIANQTVKLKLRCPNNNCDVFRAKFRYTMKSKLNYRNETPDHSSKIQEFPKNHSFNRNSDPGNEIKILIFIVWNQHYNIFSKSMKLQFRTKSIIKFWEIEVSALSGDFDIISVLEQTKTTYRHNHRWASLPQTVTDTSFPLLTK
jgi:uncharacterized beta-barrel protein YwiB (DUF1934 family)